MKLLRGDELVVDYLARLEDAAAELPAPERTALVERTRREVRERAGGGRRASAERVASVLLELGEPEEVVAGAVGTPGPPALIASAPIEVSPTFPPLLADPDPDVAEFPLDLRAVRPAHPDVERGADALTSLGSSKFEVATIVALAGLPSVLGWLGFLAGLGLILCSRFWAVRVKVASTLGFTLAGLFLAVVGAWLRATRLEESDDTGTRLATAGHALARSMELLPVGVGWVAALYLSWALLRDLGEHGRR